MTRFQPGDAVYSRPDIARNGAYAEYVAVRETEVAHKPTTISHVEAASLPLVSITAWEALFTTANLTPGQRVLIMQAPAVSAPSPCNLPTPRALTSQRLPRSARSISSARSARMK